MSPIRKVHVVFKTHLDLGFTDLAEQVRRAYVDDFIPAAIELARRLERDQRPERFVWTTGAWLIADYLANAPRRARVELDQAIRDGHIAWHALPFSTHSEMMDAGLFRHGLSISGRLDNGYGRRTIAAKMTDVPGHTIGIVPLLQEAGVKFLHIGTNPGSATPDVPETFLWRAPDGSEIVVSYASSYGATSATALEIAGVDQALHITLTNDNHGPPTPAQISELFTSLAARYPDAEIRAGRLDDFAAAAWERRHTLPVVTDEIGDTWIHGIASDPTLVRRFRGLQRWRTQAVDEGDLAAGTEEHDRFADRLLLVPEHSWGMDLKRFLPDYRHWIKPDFVAARERDVVDLSVNPVSSYPYLAHAGVNPTGGYRYSSYEASWQEQRDYVDAAIAELSPRHAIEARAAADPVEINTALQCGPDQGTASLRAGTAYQLGRLTVSLGDDGSLRSLSDSTGRVLADNDHPLAAYRYVTYDADDYARWFQTYHENLTENASWVIPDFGKPGLETTGTVHATHEPLLDSAWHWPRQDSDEVIAHLHTSSQASEMAGAPRELWLCYVFSRAENSIYVTLEWRGKDANRMPEASWLTFAPTVAQPELWTIDKLGTWISPTAVVSRGNRALHAAATGARYSGSDGHFDLMTLDAPLIAPGQPRILIFDDQLPDLSGGLHINLHNNVWGTNFRMWYDDNATFRFKLAW